MGCLQCDCKNIVALQTALRFLSCILYTLQSHRRTSSGHLYPGAYFDERSLRTHGLTLIQLYTYLAELIHS